MAYLFVIYLSPPHIHNVDSTYLPADTLNHEFLAIRPMNHWISSTKKNEIDTNQVKWVQGRKAPPKKTHLSPEVNTSVGVVGWARRGGTGSSVGRESEREIDLDRRWWWQNDGNFTDKSNNIAHTYLHKENKGWRLCVCDVYVAKRLAKTPTTIRPTKNGEEEGGKERASESKAMQKESSACIKSKWKGSIKRAQSFLSSKKYFVRSFVGWFVVVAHCFHVFFIC